MASNSIPTSQATSTGTTNSVHLVDELKHLSSVEQTLNKFLDLARQTEAHFLQRRLILSKQKPEQLIKDETDDLKAELEKKDALIKRHQERLLKWQALLRGLQAGPGGGTNVPSTGPVPAQNQPPSQPAPPPPQPIPQPVHAMSNPPQIGMGGGQHFQVTSQPTSMVQGQGQPSMMMSRPPMPPQGHQGPVPPHQPPPAYPQPGPLQYLEQTMSNFGMPERR